MFYTIKLFIIYFDKAEVLLLMPVTWNKNTCILTECALIVNVGYAYTQMRGNYQILLTRMRGSLLFQNAQVFKNSYWCWGVHFSRLDSLWVGLWNWSLFSVSSGGSLEVFNFPYLKSKYNSMAFGGRLLERDFRNQEDWQSQLAPNFLLFPIFYLIFGSNFHQIGSIGTNFGMKLAWLKLKIVPTGATLDILLYLVQLKKAFSLQFNLQIC